MISRRRQGSLFERVGDFTSSGSPAKGAARWADLWAAFTRVAAVTERMAEVGVTAAVEDHQNNPFGFAGAGNIHGEQESERLFRGDTSRRKPTRFTLGCSELHRPARSPSKLLQSQCFTSIDSHRPTNTVLRPCGLRSDDARGGHAARLRPFDKATKPLAAADHMKKKLQRLWPLIGFVAVVGSFYLLYHELKGESVGAEVWSDLKAIPFSAYLAAGASTLVAYAALAWYDHIALLHLGVKHISWIYISICSFTTYALSHNIGASAFSGAVVRYRAYSAKGLTAGQVGVLVTFCALTFALGSVLVGGLLLTTHPAMMQRLSGMLPEIITDPGAALTIGLGCLAIVGLYVIGSLMRFRPLTIGEIQIVYPRPEIMVRQLFAAPLELAGAAGIIYFTLPETGNPGFLVVLGTFLFSFSAALVSTAPAGLGVFELLFIKAMPDVPRLKVLSALLVFRLFYLVIPLLIAIAVVIIFERGKLMEDEGRGRGDPS